MAAVDERESELEIWVRPGSSRVRVAGEHAGALVVSVTAKAVDGAATEAAITAVARALGLPRRRVWLLRGASGRRKLLGVGLSRSELDRRLVPLRDPPPGSRAPAD